jgi:hypothetical protein
MSKKRKTKSEENTQGVSLGVNRLFKKFRLQLNEKTIAVSGLMILLLFFSVFSTAKYVQAENRLNQVGANTIMSGKSSADKVIYEAGSIAKLPDGETPTVALIKNISQLKGQPFFVGAENGDYLMVYTRAKKAILYRPSINKIIEYSNTN